MTDDDRPDDMTTDRHDDVPDDRADRALRDALRRHAGDLSTGPDLTDVHRRARRRSTLTIVGTAATVVALLGVTFAVTGERSGIEGRIPVADGTTASPTESSAPSPSAEPSPTPRAGWRFESFLDVQLQVPGTWVYDRDPGDQWCVSPAPSAPYVDRGLPSRSTTQVGCAPAEGEGDYANVGPTRDWVDHLRFDGLPRDAEASEERRDGWWTVRRPVGHAVVTVVSRDRNLIDEILDSAQLIDTDRHRCPVKDPIQGTSFLRPKPAFDVSQVQSVDSISVCRYVIGEYADAETPGLTDSRLLVGAAAQQELLALRAAPEGEGPSTPDSCVDYYNGDEAIALWLHSATGDMKMYVYYNWCFHNGFDDGTTMRSLTREACVPLFKPPISLYSGSSAPFRMCTDS